MKTQSEWEESEAEWDDFFKPLDEIDEAACNNIMEAVAPKFGLRTEEGWYGQAGECQFEKFGIDYYPTFFMNNDNRHFYLGNLPEFKQ